MIRFGGTLPLALRSKTRMLDHLGVRSLDDANRRFRAIGATAEHQHGIGERDGNYDFVMRSIVGDAMHRSAQARRLPGDDPYRI